ncbi:hypothetical protein BDW71DRAFT_196449 [Aspergillus fruticulosus]
MSHRGKYTYTACDKYQKPACSRCLQWQISCQYSAAEDSRRPASKAHVASLRQKIDSLERLLERHRIDSRKENQDGQAIDVLTERFEGRLAFDESLNSDKNGELRYFGPLSGRLQFQSSSALHAEETFLGAYTRPFDRLYFTWEHPRFSVIGEDLFRRDMSSGGRDRSRLLHISILALGSRFTDRVDVRSDPDDPNTAGNLFLEHANNYLGNEMEAPSLTTIQALVILGMFYIATGADAAGWFHHGMANGLCLDMGLNLDPAGFQEMNILSHLEIQLRRQIYWSLYFHDKLSSNYTGRICSMLNSQAAVRVPEDDEVVDTGNSARREFKPLQRAMIGISQIQEGSVYHTTRTLLSKPFLTRKHTETNREAAILAQTASCESARAVCLAAQKYRHVFNGFQKSSITSAHCTLSAALILLAEAETSLVSPAITSLKHKLNLCLTVLDKLSNSWSPARYIAHNLRKLCLLVTSDEIFSTETPLNFAGKSDFDATIPLDMSAELPYNASELPEHGVPQLSPMKARPSHWTLSMSVDSPPVDYGFFDILNDATWNRI